MFICPTSSRLRGTPLLCNYNYFIQPIMCVHREAPELKRRSEVVDLGRIRQRRTSRPRLSSRRRAPQAGHRLAILPAGKIPLRRSILTRAKQLARSSIMWTWGESNSRLSNANAAYYHYTTGPLDYFSNSFLINSASFCNHSLSAISYSPLCALDPL